MKIAFITASLDPGRDGVGDYTRRLAQACRELGHRPCLLSLNENDAALTSIPSEIPELRLPATTAWPHKLTAAKNFLREQQPDCVSLQFVCYGYSPNGICRNIDHWLGELTDGYDVQVMLHELWIGWWNNATLKERVVGAAQKFCVTRMLRRVHPSQIHTSIPAYVELLREAGFAAQQLPLFGNIPVVESDSGTWLLGRLKLGGVAIDAYHRDEYLIGGIFGSIHANWPTEPLLSEFAAQSRESGRRALLVSIGRMGPGKELWKRIAQAYEGRINFVSLGECSPLQISTALQALDFGIATTPLAIIGKSGSLAAMLEHGCPVVANWNDNPDQAGTPPDGVYELHSALDFAVLKRRPARPRLLEIASQFTQSLDAALEPSCSR